MTETHIGLLVIGIPALLVGGLILQRWKPVLWLFILALAGGLYYLTTIGTVDEVGKMAKEYIPNATPAAAPTPAPAPSP